MFQDPLNVPRPAFLDREDVRIFEDAVRGFMAKECVPNAERWEKQGMVDREIWTKAGEAGILCPSVPEEYGGAGGDWGHEYVFHTAGAEVGASGWGVGLHNSIIAPYVVHYGSEEQKKSILPRMISGELIGAIAMSEPGHGVGPAERQDDGDQGRQRLSHQRFEDLHHQWRLGEPHHRRRQDRPREGVRRRLPFPRRDRQGRGFQARPPARQGRHEGPGHGGTLLRGCLGARRCPARTGGGPGLHPADAAIAPGTPADRRPGRRRHEAGPVRDDQLRQGARGLRPADPEIPEHPVQAGRMQDQGQRWPRSSSTIVRNA